MYRVYGGDGAEQSDCDQAVAITMYRMVNGLHALSRMRRSGFGGEIGARSHCPFAQAYLDGIHDRLADSFGPELGRVIYLQAIDAVKRAFTD